MAADPRIRASDEDRDRTVSLLREHHAAGRLTAEEFNERIDKAYEAKTVGELDELMTDLPGIDLYRLPDAALPRYRGPGQARSRRPRAAGCRQWQVLAGLAGGLGVVAVGQRALLRDLGDGRGERFPWPVWIAGPLGAILLGRWIAGGDPAAARPPEPHIAPDPVSPRPPALAGPAARAR